jgi:hypothetical protein
MNRRELFLFSSALATLSENYPFSFAPPKAQCHPSLYVSLAEQEYSLDLQARRFVDLYHDVIDRHRSASVEQ